MAIDMSLASKAPPARRNTGPKSTGGTRQTMTEKRTEAVAGVFQLAQYGCILTHQYPDAAAIGMHGEGIAGEVAKLAAQEEKVAKVVDYLLEVGPYAGLIAAVMPFTLQILTNHGILPANKISGVVSPDVLQTRMEATLQKQAADQLAEAQQMQREASEQLAESQRAMQEATQNGSKVAQDAERA
jgi:hypothetical protein